MKQRPGSLWRNADFVKLWSGQTISNFGSGITGIALPLTAVLVLSASTVQMGILGALDGLAVLVFGLLAGVWVDRLRCRPILMAADIGRALLLASIPLAALLGVLGLVQLYIVAALAGILTVLFNVADLSYLPALIPSEQLIDANSKLAMSDSLAEIGGPTIAGPLIQVAGAPLAIVLDALSFLVSALSFGLIHTPEPPPKPAAQRQGVMHESLEGLSVIRRDGRLRALAISAALFNFFGNIIGTLYILYIVRELHISSLFIGLFIATGGISALIGTLIPQRVIRHTGVGPAAGVMLAFYGLFGLLLPLARGPLWLVLTMLFGAQLIGDASVAIYFIAEISLRQALIPRHFLGRVNASMQLVTGGIAPISAILAGVLGTAIGLRSMLFIGVGGVTLAGVWLVFSPIRKVRMLESV